MPHAGEDHGKAMRSSAAAITSCVAHRAAGLDERRWRRPRRGQQAVGEGEEGIGGTTEPLVSGSARPSASAMSSALRAAMRVESTRLIWPAPMPTVAPSRA
jgi:hypothetical protein